VSSELCRDNVLVRADIDPSTMASYGAGVVSANVAACVEAAASYAASCGGDAAKEQIYLAACRQAFAGRVQIGATCTGTLACAQPADRVGFSLCQQPAGGGPKVCIVHLPPKVGASCSPAAPSYADCAQDPSLYCSTIGSTCKVKGAVGQACDNTGGCVDGAYCGDNVICRAQGRVGDDCGGYADGCLPGATCYAASKRCVAATPKPPFRDYCR
jgi:hypothetical protein